MVNNGSEGVRNNDMQMKFGDDNDYIRNEILERQTESCSSCSDSSSSVDIYRYGK